jgi:hypothetical protein
MKNREVFLERPLTPTSSMRMGGVDKYKTREG